MENFRNENVRILVVSNVCSRCLDLPKIEVVINFGLPKNVDDYIHRIGRTGRMGKKGHAVSIITEKDIDHLKHIESFTKIQLIENEKLKRGSKGEENALKTL